MKNSNPPTTLNSATLTLNQGNSYDVTGTNAFYEMDSDDIKKYTSAYTKNLKDEDGFFMTTLLGRTKKGALSAVKKDGCYLNYIPEKLKNDKEIVLTAIKENPIALNFASEERKNDMDIALVALSSRNEYSILFSSEKLKNNPEIFDKTLSVNMDAVKCLSEDAQRSPANHVKMILKNLNDFNSFYEEILESDPLVIKNVESELKNTDKSKLIKIIEIINTRTVSEKTLVNPFLPLVIDALDEKDLQIELKNDNLKKLISDEISKRNINKVDMVAKTKKKTRFVSI